MHDNSSKDENRPLVGKALRRAAGEALADRTGPAKVRELLRLAKEVEVVVVDHARRVALTGTDEQITAAADRLRNALLREEQLRPENHVDARMHLTDTILEMAKISEPVSDRSAAEMLVEDIAKLYPSVRPLDAEAVAAAIGACRDKNGGVKRSWSHIAACWRSADPEQCRVEYARFRKRTTAQP